VLFGADAPSTYCYLLAAEKHPDADTWGVHLLDASTRGLAPDYTSADAALGLRAGQKTAWGDTPRHGDVFHILHQCETLANPLGAPARGARTRREKLQAKLGKACSPKRDGRRTAGLKRLFERRERLVKPLLFLLRVGLPLRCWPPPHLVMVSVVPGACSLRRSIRQREPARRPRPSCRTTLAIDAQRRPRSCCPSAGHSAGVLSAPDLRCSS